MSNRSDAKRASGAALAAPFADAEAKPLRLEDIAAGDSVSAAAQIRRWRLLPVAAARSARSVLIDSAHYR